MSDLWIMNVNVSEVGRRVAVGAMFIACVVGIIVATLSYLDNFDNPVDGLINFLIGFIAVVMVLVVTWLIGTVIVKLMNVGK